ncbi:MAG: 2-amino-4-hydroxy-6-hydroxymethyldihydropteridine diphosphokinase [Chloroflexota bacterium]|nr:2-amino-4-hydroxy-6-hydroxymethyldihydropteridine diphosphokinase [Chloroflexota bacterium]
MNEIIISIGSNLGDRKKYLENSIEILSKRMRLIRKSSVYETAPQGVSNHGDYLNQVVLFKSNISPVSLLNLTKRIEKKLGRKKKGDLTPRVIDIDIIIIGSKRINRRNFVVPHKNYKSRSFVLIPIKEIIFKFNQIKLYLDGELRRVRRERGYIEPIKLYSPKGLPERKLELHI